MSTALLALLRGINVGGNRIIPMADLRTCFEDLGARDVRTYIQSGNVLFTEDDDRTDHVERIERIERALSERFGHEAMVVLLTHAQLRAVVDGAPEGFGAEPERFRSDVLFLRDEVDPAQVLEAVSPREGVDTASTGDGVVYFERLTARATQSRLTRIIGTPIYRRITIRNWRTTTTLLAMLDERAG